MRRQNDPSMRTFLSHAETAMTFQLDFNSIFKERIIDPIKYTNGIQWQNKTQIITLVSIVWFDLQLSFYYLFVIPEAVSSDQ